MPAKSKVLDFGPRTQVLGPCPWVIVSIPENMHDVWNCFVSNSNFTSFSFLDNLYYGSCWNEVVFGAIFNYCCHIIPSRHAIYFYIMVHSLTALIHLWIPQCVISGEANCKLVLKVKWENCYSSSCMIKSGVRQRGVLSPAVF